MASSSADVNTLIDYDALAAALLRAGSRIAPVGLGGDASGAGVGICPNVDRKVDGSSGVASWADAVEEDEQRSASSAGLDGVDQASSVGSVEMPEVRPKRSGAALPTFGGLADSYAVSGRTPGGTKTGYYSTVVRGPNAVALRKRIEEMIGIKIPKVAHEALAICTFTAGTMPAAVAGGKDRLRSLAAVGDAALTLVLCTNQWSKGCNVESSQAVRTRLTNNAHLARVMRKAALVQYIAFAPGVDPLTGTPTATAFEAILGVLALYRSHEAVVAFVRAVGLFEDAE